MPKRKKPAIKILPPQARGKTERFGLILGGFVAAIGFFASVVSFLPRMTVDFAAQLDPSSPYLIPFTIMNTGIVPLDNMQPWVGVCKIDIEGGPSLRAQGNCDGSMPTRIHRPEWFTKRLAADDKITISLDELFSVPPPGKWHAADISIVITYQVWTIPFERQREFRFIGRHEQDGKVSWMARPFLK